MSLEEQSREFRYEIKIILETAQVNSVLTTLKLHPYAFFQPYPLRQVNNIYFETQQLTAYEENLSGISERTKTRYRWYGDLNNHQKGILELKVKKTSLGTKLFYPVSGIDLTQSWASIAEVMQQSLPEQGQLHFKMNRQPALINSYHRQYFESRDHTLRVTIDQDINFYGQLHSNKPNLSRKENTANFAVLEVKCSPTHRSQAMKILDHIPVRASRMSKFVTGMNASLGI